MPAPSLARFAAFAAATLALLVAAVIGPIAPAGAAKAPAPTLTIESKVCQIGVTEEERNVTVTALALLGDAGQRVTMRFTLQSRLGKTKWKSVPFKDPSITKKWETTEGVRAGLKLTKTIPNLPEGYAYRVVVESRGVDGNGKVVTRTAKRYVNCLQPLFTPTIVLTKIQGGSDPSDPEAGDALTVSVKNIGRLTSSDYTVTITSVDAPGKAPIVKDYPSLKGGGTNRFTIPLGGACTGLLTVTVQTKELAAEPLRPDQASTVSCAGDPTTTATTSRRR